MIIVNLVIVVFFIYMLFALIESLTSAKNKALLTLEKTEVIKGIATLMIVLSHIIQYVGNKNIVCGGGKLSITVIRSFGGIGVAIFFFLSGFGNFISLSNVKERKLIILKVLRKILRLISTFIICFILVFSVKLIISSLVDIPIVFEKSIQSLFSLRMEGSTTWYLKVQILLYIFMMFDFLFVNNKYRNVFLIFLTIAYVIFANNYGLLDFWWKTSFCFSMGAIIAKNRKIIEKFIEHKSLLTLIASFFLVVLSYIWLIKDRNYAIVVQLFSFSVLSIGVCFICSLLNIKNKFLRIVGNNSYPVYLIHIGLAEILLTNNNVELSVIVFIILTIILSAFVFFFDATIANFNNNWIK